MVGEGADTKKVMEVKIQIRKGWRGEKVVKIIRTGRKVCVLAWNSLTGGMPRKK